MKKLILTTLAIIALVGCTTATAVPKATFKWNPKTGDVQISSPKDSEIENLVIMRGETNGMKFVTIQVGKYKTSMNPENIKESAAGTAAMIQSGGNVALQSFVQGISAAQAAGVIPKIPSPPQSK